MHRYSIVEDGVTLEKAEKALILLHGRGGTAEDIMQLAPEFDDGTFCIRAPRATGNTWYPNTFLAPEETNEPWLISAVLTVKRLIDETAEKIPLDKIFIMGFSQGACLSLEVAGRYPAEYGGVVAFSGGLIGERVRPEKYHGKFENTRIFIGNSDTDPHIPLSRTSESAGLLENMGATVLFRIYPGMPHTVTDEEIEDVRRFLFV